MSEKIKVLDCTLRDGGQGLEDLHKNGLSTTIFSSEDRANIAKSIVDSNIDIVELGCIVESNTNTEGFAIYNDVEKVSGNMPKKKNSTQLFTGLFTGPDIDLDRIPAYKDGYVDGLRVILRYSQLEKSIDFCRGLAQKGYKVFVQPMLTMRYTEEQLKYLIDSPNEMGAYALYFVDSFGYMESDDVRRLYQIYDRGLNKYIRIGFHAHNNLDLAFENVKAFIDFADSDRNIIVDSCAYGMGQGAGNMQTELLLPYLNKKYDGLYDTRKIFDACDILLNYVSEDMTLWGYSPVRAVTAIHKAAYKYAVDMKYKRNMSLVEIYDVLSKMQQEDKHRYTPENLDRLLKKGR